MKLFSRNKKRLSLDFGSSSIKVIEGQVTKAGVNVFASESISLPKVAYEDGNILDIRGMSNLIESKIKRTKMDKDLRATAIINSSAIITREINIPKVEENEVDPLVGYQISEFLPINVEDYEVNYLILETIEIEGVERLKLFLIAIPKTMVMNHLNLMKESDLKAEILDFQGNTMAKLLDFNTMVNEEYHLVDKTVVSVDIGYESTNVSIVKAGNMEVTRTFKIGANTLFNDISQMLNISLEEAEEKLNSIKDINKESEILENNSIINVAKGTMGFLIESVQSVIRYYTSRTQTNVVDLILLQGRYSNLNGMKDFFEENLGINTVRLESLDKVKFDGDLSIYANAIGGLIRRDEVKR